MGGVQYGVGQAETVRAGDCQVVLCDPGSAGYSRKHGLSDRTDGGGQASNNGLCMANRPQGVQDVGDRKGIGGRMTKPERHKALCNILNEIYKQKNQAYGDSFHDTFVEEGLAMARIRLSDKLNRFKTLSRNPNIDQADESLTDTLLDLANYALMTILEIDS